jgi:hypothetical protein
MVLFMRRVLSDRGFDWNMRVSEKLAGKAVKQSVEAVGTATRT